MYARRLISLALAAASALLALSCMESVDTPTATQHPVPSNVRFVLIDPPQAIISPGHSLSLQAIAENSAQQPISGQTAAWQSSNPSVADVSSDGTVTAHSLGVVTISAMIGTMTANAALSVQNVSSLSDEWVYLSPATTDVLVGHSVQISAQVKTGAGVVLPNAPLSFTTSNAGVATVSSTGSVHGVAAGTAVITARSDSTQSTALVNVVAATVASVAVTPSTASVAVNRSVQLTATPKDASGTPLTGHTITWSASNTGVATITPDGLVMALSPGTSTISATCDGVTGTAVVTVTAPAPTQIVISPAASNVTVGRSVGLTATVKDASGATIANAPVSWSSSATGVATVSGSGVVAGVATGNATITAQSGSLRATASVTVVQVPVASVSVSPSSVSLAIGAAQALSTTVRDASGNVLTGRIVTWASANSAIAIVSSTGTVTGVRAGTTTVTATSGGVSGSASVTVNAPVTPPVTPPGGGGSHEPSGMALLTDRAWNSVAQNSTDYAGAEGWSPDESRWLRSYGISSDPLAPESPSSIAQMVYPAGLNVSPTASYSPVDAWLPITGRPHTLYFSAYIKISSNWVGHFSRANKLFEVFINNRVNVVFGLLGADSLPLYPSIAIDDGPDPRLGSYLPQNVARVPMSRGQWHHVEFLVVANTPGVRDGVAMWWLDGQLLANYTDIAWVAAGASNYWMQFSMYPIWGGTGGTLTATQYLWVDDVYLSQK